MEGLRLYSSCQDAVGIDGEVIEFEWKKFPNIFHHCLFLEEIQDDLETRRIPSSGVHRPNHLHVNVQ